MVCSLYILYFSERSDNPLLEFTSTSIGFKLKKDTSSKKILRCDRVFRHGSNPFGAIAPIITNAFSHLKSGIVCVVGPSQSGKTGLLCGHSDDWKRGLVPQSIIYLYSLIDGIPIDDSGSLIPGPNGEVGDHRRCFQVKVSAFEIACDKVIDVLAPLTTGATIDQASVQMAQDEAGLFVVGDLSHFKAEGPRELLQVFFHAVSRRCQKKPPKPSIADIPFIENDRERSVGSFFFNIILTHLPTGRRCTLTFTDIAAAIQAPPFRVPTSPPKRCIDRDDCGKGPKPELNPNHHIKQKGRDASPHFFGGKFSDRHGGALNDCGDHQSDDRVSGLRERKNLAARVAFMEQSLAQALLEACNNAEEGYPSTMSNGAASLIPELAKHLCIESSPTKFNDPYHFESGSGGLLATVGAGDNVSLCTARGLDAICDAVRICAVTRNAAEKRWEVVRTLHALTKELNDNPNGDVEIDPQSGRRRKSRAELVLERAIANLDEDVSNQLASPELEPFSSSQLTMILKPLFAFPERFNAVVIVSTRFNFSREGIKNRNTLINSLPFWAALSRGFRRAICSTGPLWRKDLDANEDTLENIETVHPGEKLSFEANVPPLGDNTRYALFGPARNVTFPKWTNHSKSLSRELVEKKMAFLRIAQHELNGDTPLPPELMYTFTQTFSMASTPGVSDLFLARKALAEGKKPQTTAFDKERILNRQASVEDLLKAPLLHGNRPNIKSGMYVSAEEKERRAQSAAAAAERRALEHQRKERLVRQLLAEEANNIKERKMAYRKSLRSTSPMATLKTEEEKLSEEILLIEEVAIKDAKLMGKFLDEHLNKVIDQPRASIAVKKVLSQGRHTHAGDLKHFSVEQPDMIMLGGGENPVMVHVDTIEEVLAAENTDNGAIFVSSSPPISGIPLEFDADGFLRWPSGDVVINGRTGQPIRLNQFDEIVPLYQTRSTVLSNTEKAHESTDEIVAVPDFDEDDAKSLIRFGRNSYYTYDIRKSRFNDIEDPEFHEPPHVEIAPARISRSSLGVSAAHIAQSRASMATLRRSQLGLASSERDEPFDAQTPGRRSSVMSRKSNANLTAAANSRGSISGAIIDFNDEFPLKKSNAVRRSEFVRRPTHEDLAHGRKSAAAGFIDFASSSRQRELFFAEEQRHSFGLSAAGLNFDEHGHYYDDNDTAIKSIKSINQSPSARTSIHLERNRHSQDIQSMFGDDAAGENSSPNVVEGFERIVDRAVGDDNEMTYVNMQHVSTSPLLLSSNDIPVPTNSIAPILQRASTSQDVSEKNGRESQSMPLAAPVKHSNTVAASFPVSDAVADLVISQTVVHDKVVLKPTEETQMTDNNNNTLAIVAEDEKREQTISNNIVASSVVSVLTEPAEIVISPPLHPQVQEGKCKVSSSSSENTQSATAITAKNTSDLILNGMTPGHEILFHQQQQQLIILQQQLQLMQQQMLHMNTQQQNNFQQQQYLHHQQLQVQTLPPSSQLQIHHQTSPCVSSQPASDQNANEVPPSVKQSIYDNPLNGYDPRDSVSFKPDGSFSVRVPNAAESHHVSSSNSEQHQPSSSVIQQVTASVEQPKAQRNSNNQSPTTTQIESNSEQQQYVLAAVAPPRQSISHQSQLLPQSQQQNDDGSNNFVLTTAVRRSSMSPPRQSAFAIDKISTFNIVHQSQNITELRSNNSNEQILPQSQAIRLSQPPRFSMSPSPTQYAPSFAATPQQIAPQGHQSVNDSPYTDPYNNRALQNQNNNKFVPPQSDQNSPFVHNTYSPSRPSSNAKLNNPSLQKGFSFNVHGVVPSEVLETHRDEDGNLPNKVEFIPVEQTVIGYIVIPSPKRASKTSPKHRETQPEQQEDNNQLAILNMDQRPSRNFNSPTNPSPTSYPQQPQNSFYSHQIQSPSYSIANPAAMQDGEGRDLRVTSASPEVFLRKSIVGRNSIKVVDDLDAVENVVNAKDLVIVHKSQIIGHHQ